MEESLKGWACAWQPQEKSVLDVAQHVLGLRWNILRHDVRAQLM
eukprot:CAMPEP_0183361384 /NCGR_PEP_ID=MMETSP0164_2-20130417/60033_1 /TAXON_ID=221442 /ORGANISM="Coccolithus pelagicus ssp braarudi, Strain PLY182g" /LENGTH=43 /DNA_ID= /DNA_START= /DNA_END= /DNA_ORIENTATION=